MSPFVSIIVPVYNQWNLVSDLLLCIERQSYREFELLLVDNGSSQGPALDQLSEGVRQLYCGAPGSYAARNLGASEAKGDLLAFTDADCMPSSDWLESAVQQYSRGANRVTLVAGAVEMLPADATAPNLFELYDMALGIPQALYVKRGHAATANLLVPNHLFRDLGGFDSTRFSGGDTDFCRRAINSGAELIYCQEARVQHRARSSLDAHVKKVQRIKGGQLLHGSARTQFTSAVRSFLPPLRVWSRILRSPLLGVREKWSVCGLQFRLWGAEISEVIRLTLLRKAPRR